MNEQKNPGDHVQPKVLVVDDEIEFIQRVGRLLGEGHELEAASNWAGAKRMLEKKPFDVILLDWDLSSGRDGLEIIEKLRESGPLSLSIILISKFMRKELELSGYEKGADYCMTKALDDEAMKREISNAIKRNLEKRELIARTREKSEEIVSPVFNSKGMKSLLDQLAGFINTRENILITGERGTGKGVLAKWVHQSSNRNRMILTHIHIPGLQEELLNSELFGHQKGAFAGAHKTMPGLLEVSHKGTMILDEIAELKLEHQSKFLRMLQEKTFRRVRGVEDIPFDTRFISLTNHQDLDQEVRSGRFRGDLLDRLRPCHVHLPPLRERKGDIPEIAADILAHYKKEYNRPDIEGFEDSLMEMMLEYEWPGNVRDLEHWISSGVLNAYGNLVKINDIERSGIAGREKAGKLPFDEDFYSMTFEKATDYAQKTLLEHVIAANRGNMSLAAEKLGIHRVNIYRQCKRLGIDFRKFKKVK